MVYILMGVSGSGKTTVGKLLADQLQLPFYDADDYHSTANITKMSKGVALNDADRLEWLTQLRLHITQWQKNGGAVLACSALKERYRKILQPPGTGFITWIFLKAPRQIIEERLIKRKGHYMNPSLSSSQFETLEEPTYGIHIDVKDAPEKIVEQLLKQLK
ncbi:MAG: gluconokinase [Flavisolibacter sp.]